MMLVVIQSELASHRQVDAGESAEVGSEAPQYLGVIVVHAKPGTNTYSRRRRSYIWTNDLPQSHACRLR
jgi:hypothetical protein